MSLSMASGPLFSMAVSTNNTAHFVDELSFGTSIVTLTNTASLGCKVTNAGEIVIQSAQERPVVPGLKYLTSPSSSVSQSPRLKIYDCSVFALFLTKICSVCENPGLVVNDSVPGDTSSSCAFISRLNKEITAETNNKK